MGLIGFIIIEDRMVQEIRIQTNTLKKNFIEAIF